MKKALISGVRSPLQQTRQDRIPAAVLNRHKINALFTELNGTPVNVVNKFTKAIKKRNFARTRSKKIARHTLKGFM